LRDPRYVASADELEHPRHELLVDALGEVRTRARRYLQEPGDTAWHELVRALARCFGDSPSYELMRAVEIHSRTAPR
jgi:hypothetical protein